MSKTYLVTFTPLEAYFFGGNRQFQFKNRENYSEDDFSPYFIKGNPLPEQSTIFGSLRYLILEQAGLIKKDFNYSADERKAMEEFVGTASFSLLVERESFGKIQRISPLFFLKNNKEKIIPTPFNFVEENDRYRPMKLQDRPVQTTYGKLYLPVEGAYDPKQGYRTGYYNLQTGREEEKIYKTVVVTGNRIPDRSQSVVDNKDGLFKREVYHLQDGYRFATYVTVEDDLVLKNGFVQMGQKASIFKVEVTEEEDNLAESVRSHLASITPQGVTWHYALSDQVVTGLLRTSDFSIVEDRQVRQIQTNLNGNTFTKRISLQSEYHNLQKAGSCYYGEIQEDNRVNYATVAGYNVLIEIKGEK
ncbi:TPA: hypothetical protein U1D11_001330 [Streptococcus suis]|nr:hypothetical protein [Streptococcus suis]